MKNKALLTCLCILLAELLVALVLWFLGFRITYAPTLENSWDAISACAGWAGAIFSLIAILVAIQIPKKIADRQDRVALLEKRIQTYAAIQDLCGCAAQIENATSDEQVLTSFKLHLGNEHSLETTHNGTSLVYKIRQIETLIIFGDFLFSEYDVKLLQDMTMEAIRLLFAALESEKKKTATQLTAKVAEHKTKLCEIYHKVHPRYIDGMESQLYLVNRK